MDTKKKAAAGNPAAAKAKEHRHATAAADHAQGSARQQEDLIHAGLALVPIPKGQKGPNHKGWNERGQCITTLDGLPRLTGKNVGLAHAYCTPTPTCALDLDDLNTARPWLAERGIDVGDLLLADDAVQVSSGRPGRAKLLYRLPRIMPTVQVKEAGLELRCGTPDGKTVQDVLPPSIHPDTGQPYEWIGNPAAIPPAPRALLALWESLTAVPAKCSAATDAMPADGTVTEGGRNDYLSRKAYALRKDGLAPDAILAVLLPLNQQACIPPLPDGEVEAIARGKAAVPPGEFAGDDRRIAELAALPLLDYERRREDAAKELGCRASVLDKLVEAKREERAAAADSDAAAMLFPEVEPWPEPVSGADVLDRIAATYRRYAVLPPHADTTMALWVCFTYAIDFVHVAPILGIVSPEKRCGKTTVLSITARLVHRPLPSSNISPAALFRSIEQWKPTLLIDEADTFLRESEELRGVLNCGHTRDTAFVTRVEKINEVQVAVKFSTWGPKAIALIGKLKDTLHDRAINVELRRKLPGEKTAKLRHADQEQFTILRRQLVRFVADNGEAIGRSIPDTPPELNDRAADNWEPLLAIADVAGGKWPKLARLAASALSGAQADPKSTNQELLEDIHEVFRALGKARIRTSELIGSLCSNEEARWRTYNHGKSSITPKQVANRLREFGVISKDIRFGIEVAKGYHLADFKDAFERYLTAASADSATALLD